MAALTSPRELLERSHRVRCTAQSGSASWPREWPGQAWLARGFEPLPEYLDVLTRDHGAPLGEQDFASERDEVSMLVMVPEQLERFELTPAGSTKF